MEGDRLRYGEDHHIVFAGLETEASRFVGVAALLSVDLAHPPMPASHRLSQERTRLKIRDRDRDLLARREEVVSEGHRARNPEQTGLLPKAKIGGPADRAPR